MTDTGQVPGEGLPDSAGMVDQQSVPAPVQIPAPIPAGYAFQDLMDNPAEPEDEELLLMPSGQGAWSDPQVVPQAPAFPAAPQLGEPQMYPDPSYAAAPAYPEAPAAYTEFPPPVFPDGGYSAGAHETGGRDSGALDLGGLVVPPRRSPRPRWLPRPPSGAPCTWARPCPRPTAESYAPSPTAARPPRPPRPFRWPP